MTPQQVEARIAANADAVLRSMERLSKGDTFETIATLFVAAAALARAEKMSFSDFLVPARMAWTEIHPENKLENLPFTGKGNPFAKKVAS